LSKRAADRQHPIANLHAIGIAQLGGRQWMIDIHLDHGQIGFLIGPDHLGIMLHARSIVFKAHANAVRFLDYVPIRKNVAFGIDDHSGTERTFTNRSIAGSGSLPSRASEEVIEEIVHTAAIFVVAATAVISAAASVHILDRRFRIDVDDARLQLLRNLRKGIRHHLRGRQGERRGFAFLLPFFPLHPLGDHRTDQNANGQGSQDTECVGPAVSLHAHPHRARVHN
jgi:hypothetical protein